MIVCIIAGGSGTRLWPLSTSEYPKHLMKINGSDRSLLQNTYDRAKLTASQIYVVTEASHAHHVKDQLPDLSDDNFIIEPARRGTASCTVAAMAYIAERHGREEPLAVISADHYIRDVEGYVHSFRVAAETAASQKRIVMIGVEPDHPSTGFGYIKKAEIFDEERLIYEVDSFKEKPDYDTALEYLKSGKYLWNCSYPIAPISTFLERMESVAPQWAENFNLLVDAKDGQEYLDRYLGFENTSIDFALLDYVEDLMVVPASFDWMDLGSYADLHKAVGSDKEGNYIRKGDNVEIEDVENCYVENHDKDTPVALVGLNNVVVVNTSNGVLVARKDLGQKVGVVAKRIAKKNG